MEERDLYVLGSINLDLGINANRMPKQGETISGFNYIESLGGKGCNQATATSKLGTCTHLIGSVGKDYFGQLALNRMSSNGIDIDNVRISDTEPTGTAIIIRIDNDNRIIINQGANGDINRKSVSNTLQSANNGDIFLTQFEVPLYIVLEALNLARQNNLITVVNPAPAAMMSDDFYPLIDFLIINQSECETLSGIQVSDASTCSEASQFFLEKGVKHIVFTLGEIGSILIKQDKMIEIDAMKVNVVDTTGAGDAFIGGFVYGLSRNYSLDLSLKYGTGAGALACTKPGAQEGLIDLEQLDKFIR